MRINVKVGDQVVGTLTGFSAGMVAVRESGTLSMSRVLLWPLNIAAALSPWTEQNPYSDVGFPTQSTNAFDDDEPSHIAAGA